MIEIQNESFFWRNERRLMVTGKLKLTGFLNSKLMRNWNHREPTPKETYRINNFSYSCYVNSLDFSLHFYNLRQHQRMARKPFLLKTILPRRKARRNESSSKTYRENDSSISTNNLFMVMLPSLWTFIQKRLIMWSAWRSDGNNSKSFCWWATAL